MDNSWKISLLRNRDGRGANGRHFRVLATTVDGRPIKLDGNPLHPATGGRPTRSLRRRS